MARRLPLIRRLALVLGFAAVVFSTGARAVEPDEMLKDPVLEARAQAITKGLRCVVCQNQNIDDSAAPIAGDMRRLVRERLVAGDTDKQAQDYLVARYGNFVLLRPPVQPDTWLLWFGPLGVMLIAGAGFFFYVRRGRPSAPPAPLTAEEQRRLQTLLNDDLARTGR